MLRAREAEATYLPFLGLSMPALEDLYLQHTGPTTRTSPGAGASTFPPQRASQRSKEPWPRSVLPGARGRPGVREPRLSSFCVPSSLNRLLRALLQPELARIADLGARRRLGRSELLHVNVGNARAGARAKSGWTARRWDAEGEGGEVAGGGGRGVGRAGVARGDAADGGREAH
ncbi:hypothetical protein CALCODRAFT_373618 [Calocera cornea HHB12733]|uniref:Uncharacterized protein n=1 Tax=Calocera cornea HHB12733 TaxID=1353952 RepID=A0A165EG75_9BASI|nr:hypothetical protein CALCODRAFT_373618 [Calocera cornea HHB12733]